MYKGSHTTLPLPLVSYSMYCIPSIYLFFSFSSWICLLLVFCVYSTGGYYICTLYIYEFIIENEIRIHIWIIYYVCCLWYGNDNIFSVQCICILCMYIHWSKSGTISPYIPFKMACVSWRKYRGWLTCFLV